MPGLALGSAMRIAAGAAMYEALAASVAITAIPPTDIPTAEPSTAPTEPLINGTTMANTATRIPAPLKSRSRFAAIAPSSMRNNVSAPENNPTNNGSVGVSRSGPTIRPMESPATRYAMLLPRTT